MHCFFKQIISLTIGAEFVILPRMRKLCDVKIKTLPFDYLRCSEDEQINTSQS